MGKKKITVAVYCRVASSEQLGNTLESQQMRLKNCARKPGLEIVGSFSDVGSGLNMDHPGGMLYLRPRGKSRCKFC